MRALVLVVAVLVLHAAIAARKRPRPFRPKPPTPTKDPNLLKPITKDEQDEILKLRKLYATLIRQSMLNRLFIEERVRSDGASGVKQIRHGSEGTRPYHSNTFTGGSVMSIHEHSNNIRTVGMGEFIGVLNGVEFRTRHNDYRLNMPSKTSTRDKAIEPIPFPPVPEEVLDKKTVDEQIVEMRQWFKAFRDQDHSVRDYRKHFKPVLCYLEGGWTHSTKKIEEPFFSDRHFVDAKNWDELLQKIRFTSYSGRKSNLENFAYLPTTIMDIENGTIPKIAQWNFRILCHPVNRDIPLNRLRVIDDLHARVAKKSQSQRFSFSRAARYEINPSDKDTWGTEHASQHGLLDELMEQIPGKNNYMGKLADDASGEKVLQMKSNAPLNTAYYHRMYRVRDGNGFRVEHRGFSDPNVFMAQNTQPSNAGMKIKLCTQDGKYKGMCRTVEQKWTYAIPLELVWLTPLNAWNPYDLLYRASKTDSRNIYANGRNGRPALETAYNGTGSRYYYRTPDKFFSGKSIERDAADTARSAVGVLDRQGVMRAVRASGMRIFLPNIPEVGVLRQRYPIMPGHQDGNTMWKEISALKDAIMEQGRYVNQYRQPPPFITSASVLNKTHDEQLTFKTTVGVRNPPGPHIHYLSVDKDMLIQAMNKRQTISVFTDERAGHMHQIELFVRRKCKKIPGQRQRECKYFYSMKSCDGSRRCWDGHGANLIQDKTS